MPRKAVVGGSGKRVSLNMRTTKETREMLESAAAQSGRSLVQEVERRVEDSFTREESFGEWVDLYRLVRTYIMSIAVLRNTDGEAAADALHVGFGVIIDAAYGGPLPDERLKELHLKVIPDLGRRGGNNAAGIAMDALNVLSAAKLVRFDHNKLAAWLKEAGDAR